MQANYSSYRHTDSKDRVDEILNSSDVNYEEKDSIPSRDQLTFTNGFYVNCSSMFVDIRGSKDLAGKYKRPTLARIYRCYLSEVVAVMRDHTKVCEVSIQGDCVWGVFDTNLKVNIDELISVSAKVSSMIDILNWRLDKKGIDSITVGIGMDYGRALMIKAGYKGSGINDVVWMGDVVNQASKLCAYGNQSWNDSETMISNVIYNNLNDENKKLFSWSTTRSCYQGNVVNTVMDEWLKQQKEAEDQV